MQSKIIVSVIFMVVLGFLVFTKKEMFLVLPFYLGISLVTFILYAVDKLAAKKGLWRIKENTLHFFALAGGWPGALMAQQILRHKSWKQPFGYISWLTVILNIIVVLVWLLLLTIWNGKYLNFIQIFIH